MTDKHPEYNFAVDAYTQRIIDDIFHELHEELDLLEQNLENSEISQIVLAWVRDRVDYVSENYKNK